MFPTWRMRLRKKPAWRAKTAATTKPAGFSPTKSFAIFSPPNNSRPKSPAKSWNVPAIALRRATLQPRWHDLSTANRLGGQDELIHQLRHTYEDRSLREVRQCLAVGQPGHAIKCLEKLRKRGLADDRIRTLQQIATLMQEANQLAARGHFAEAVTAINRAESFAKLPQGEPGIMDEVAARLHAEHDRFKAADAIATGSRGEMHSALTAENWSAVLTAPTPCSRSLHSTSPPTRLGVARGRPSAWTSRSFMFANRRGDRFRSHSQSQWPPGSAFHSSRIALQ